MIKNNVTVLLVQIALAIACLTVNLFIVIIMGDRPQTETVTSWLNLGGYVFVFFFVGKTKLNPQGHWIKNACSVLLTSAVCFLLLLVLSDNLYRMGHFVRLIVWVLMIPVHWAWDFKNTPIWIRSLFIFIPALASFIGLYSQLYKKTSLN